MNLQMQTFFDDRTSTLTYVVYDLETRDAVCIDPVLDFDQASGQLWKESVRLVKKCIDDHKLNLHFILETHAHADHLSGALELRQLYPNAQIAIGENIKKVQSVFKDVFCLSNLKTDGSQFDRLLKDGELLHAGQLEVRVIFTPGHTPACASYLIGDHLFVGDAIFMPDSGTGRCDFPAGSAEDLFNSITKKIYTLPDHTKIYVGHDYQPNGRPLQYQTTVGEEKNHNIQLKAATTKPDYIQFRKERDKTLAAPKLLLPSIQVNIAAGQLPDPDVNGVSYLKLPLRWKS